MGILLWPVAVLVFLFWSLVAWIMFGFSDWAAGIVGGSLGGILSAELGPWAQWITSRLGDIIQVAVVLVWAAVGLFILSAPVLLRRHRREQAAVAPMGSAGWPGEAHGLPPSAPGPERRHDGFLPHGGGAFGGGGPAPAPASGTPFGWRRDRTDDDDDDDDDRKRRRWRGEGWRRRLEPAIGDMRDLGQIARGMAGRYKDKRRRKDDDD